MHGQEMGKRERVRCGSGSDYHRGWYWMGMSMS